MTHTYQKMHREFWELALSRAFVVQELKWEIGWLVGRHSVVWTRFFPTTSVCEVYLTCCFLLFLSCSPLHPLLTNGIPVQKLFAIVRSDKNHFEKFISLSLHARWVVSLAVCGVDNTDFTVERKIKRKERKDLSSTDGKGVILRKKEKNREGRWGRYDQTMRRYTLICESFSIRQVEKTLLSRVLLPDRTSTIEALSRN